MTLRVLKFGGTSVGSPERILAVAQRISRYRKGGDKIVVVVSAMGQTTDELLRLAFEVCPRPPRRELDMLLTAGERISMALLAMALRSLEIAAISFTGSQSGIVTSTRHQDARIHAVRPFRIEEELEKDKVVIVAGFQGVSSEKEVTTLGRGGSDTTAVALAIRLGAPCCEIYTDVDGVLTADPRRVESAERLERIGYGPMIALSHLGGRVLFHRAVALARKYGMPIHVRSAFLEGGGTWIESSDEQGSRSPAPGKEIEPMESNRILGITLEAPVHYIYVTLPAGSRVPLIPGLKQGAADDVAESPEPLVSSRQKLADGGIAVAWVFRAGDPIGDWVEASAWPHDAVVRFETDAAAISIVGEGASLSPDSLTEIDGILQAEGIDPMATQCGAHSLVLVVKLSEGDRCCKLLHDRLIGASDEEARD